MLRSAMDSAAIEGNTLSYRQVAAISKGEYIEAPFDELTEIKDAVDAYRLMPSLRTWSVEDFLEAHDAMTFGLLEKPGFRDGAVGIFRAGSSSTGLRSTRRCLRWWRSYPNGARSPISPRP